MMDLIAQGSALAEALKKALKLADDLKNVEMHQTLLDLRKYLGDLRDENASLRNDIRELRERLSLREELTFSKNVWWKVDDKGKSDGPYCPKCYGDRDKAVRMGSHEVHLPGYSTTRYYRCAVCGLSVEADV